MRLISLHARRAARVIVGLIVLVSSGAGSSSIAAQVRQAVPSVAEIRALLQSGDPRDQAWGAWWAAQAQARELALFIEVTADAQADSSWPAAAATQAALDALIQLHVPVAVESARALYPRWPAQTLILLSRAGPDANAFLLELAGRETGVKWLAAADLLLPRRAAGFAAALLRDLEIQAHVFVVSDANSGGGAGFGVDGGVADGVMQVPAGYPPLAHYYFDTFAHPGAVVLASGPTTIYFEREVASPERGSGASWHDRRAPTTKDRIEYVKALLSGAAPGADVPLQSMESRSVVWSDQAALDAAVQAFRADILARHHSLVASLAAVKLLTDSEAAAVSPPAISTHIHDARKEPMTPPTTEIADRALATMKIPGSADFLVEDGDAVWITNRGRMEKLVHDQSAPVASVAVPRPCGGPAIGFGSVWVANCPDRSIYRIDTATATVAATIATGLADRSGELSLAAGAGAVWVLTDATGVLSRIDPATNAVVAKITVAPNSYAAAFGFDSVWVTNTGARGATGPGALQRIDPATNTVIATIPVGPAPRFLTVGEGAVWTLNQGDGTVSRIDPATNRVVATIDAGVPGTLGDIAAGAGRVWVRATKVLLQAIDPGTNRVVEIFGPPAGSGAVRVAGDRVWVSAHDIQAVWVLRGGY